MKKYLLIIVFVLTNSKSLPIQNKKSLKENLTLLLENRKIVSFTAASLFLLFVILIKNYLQRQNKKKFKEKEQTLNKKASEKKNNLKITVDIIDNNQKYEEILPSLQLIYNPYQFTIDYKLYELSLKQKEHVEKLNSLSKEELNRLTELLLCLISMNRSDLFKCRFCKECRPLICNKFNGDFWSEVDLYKEGYYDKDKNDENKYIKNTIIKRIYFLNQTFNHINFDSPNKKISLTNTNYKDQYWDNSNKDIIGESNNRIIIAKNSKGECLGFIYYNEIYNNQEKTQSLWLRLLATNPEHQKKGVMSILMQELKKENLPIALCSDHPNSKHSPGPKFYLQNNFTAMNIKTFLKKANKINDPFYCLSNSQKEHLEGEGTNSQIYIWWEPQ